MCKPFVMQPDESRTSAPLEVFGNRIRILLSAIDTAGGYSVFSSEVPPLSGPPLHRHNREDEWWHVLEGEFRFEVDGEVIIAGPGSSVFAGRGTVHTFQNVSPETGRMLTVVEPAGVDQFFEEVAAAGHSDPSLLAPIFKKYDLEVLGPPIAVREAMKSAAA